MTEPILKKYPAEIFGKPYTDNSAATKRSRNKQHCPFLDAECKKPRKSEPHIKVGLFSVGYKGNASENYLPVIICPHRLDTQVIFRAVQANCFAILGKDEKIVWASEVSIPQAGSADYVLAKTKNDEVVDFVCVELQAAGTTGTPWEAFLEHKRTGKFSKDSYNFGINWANEFAKTMMQQAYKKGTLVQFWKKKIVFAIQDVGLDYLHATYDTSDLHPALDSDPIHFYTFKMIWNDATSAWQLHLAERLSTNAEGVRKILAGTTSSKFPSVDEFVERIKRKLLTT